MNYVVSKDIKQREIFSIILNLKAIKTNSRAIVLNKYLI